jgi:hypothetical protein
MLSSSSAMTAVLRDFSQVNEINRGSMLPFRAPLVRHGDRGIRPPARGFSTSSPAPSSKSSMSPTRRCSSANASVARLRLRCAAVHDVAIPKRRPSHNVHDAA